MSELTVHTLDLNFQNKPGSIACYLVPYSQGAALIETGPGSTIPALVAGLEKHHLKPQDITDVFVTHIHLDHAGASGWLAQQGARIYVHTNGAPHLLAPEKLLASANRIYGDQMERLWGQFLPVPEEKLVVLQDGQTVEVGQLKIQALDVQGHANHHLAYLLNDVLFSGDIGGVRIQGTKYISLPMPPPEFHLEKWRESIHKIQYLKPRCIVPTHFGLFDDARWHLCAVLTALDQVEAWIERNMPSDPPIEQLRQLFIEFEYQRASQSGLDESAIEAQLLANPPFMSADGIQRYWRKFRTNIS